MKYKPLIYIFVLAVCLITLHFFTPVYAYDGSGETLTVNAVWVDGDMLRINVTDANGVNSAFALNLKDYVNDSENSEYISIQAVDLAGNRSGIIEVKNPYYKPPVKILEIPVETVENSTEDNIPPEIKPSEPTQSAIPDGSKPFTPDGTGTVMDNAHDGDGKEFFTIDTEDGSVFYLIIDRQRNTDNVYLLNAVTLDDLVALAEKNGKNIKIDGNGSTSSIPSGEQSNTTEAQSEPSPNTTEPKSEIGNVPPAKSGNNNTIIFVIIAVLAVGGAGFYFKIIKGKKKNIPDSDDDDEDYEFENEQEEFDNYDDNNDDDDSKDGGDDE